MLIAGLFANGPVQGSEPKPLYAGQAPGSETWAQQRVEIHRGHGVAVYNTSQPVYTVHLPDAEIASGAAVVMLPGGGLRMLGTGAGLDGEVADLLAHGVAVLVLEYRTLQLSPAELAQMTAPPPPRDPSAAPPRFPRMTIINGNANPAAGDARMDEVLRLATDDAQAALRLLHENAEAWQIDPDRIGVMGTSAGGGVAFGALMDRAAPVQEQPDFLISIYGPSLQDLAAWEDAPPLFLAVEADHGAVTDGLIEAFRIWNAAYQSAELHIYKVPRQAFTRELWGARLFEWMAEQQITPPQDNQPERPAN